MPITKDATKPIRIKLGTPGIIPEAACGAAEEALAAGACPELLLNNDIPMLKKAMIAVLSKDNNIIFVDIFFIKTAPFIIIM
jgi:hypothetical protein